MTDFKVGDRVVVFDRYRLGTHNVTGVVSKLSGANDGVQVELDKEHHFLLAHQASASFWVRPQQLSVEGSSHRRPQLPSRQIYMAGPITGLDYEDAAKGWRTEFPKLLNPHIRAFSPMRGKEHLAGLEEKIGDKAYPTHPGTTAQAIVTRDHNDVYTCDAMVANFIGAPRASLGTAIEFGWAHAYKKPIIMIVEPDGSNVHEHLMLTEIAGYRVHSLNNAAILINHLFTPGV